MNCKIDELYKLKKCSKDITNNDLNITNISNELNDTYKISFYILFSDRFIRKYTAFDSHEEMLKKTGVKIEFEEDIEKYTDDELDLYIKNNSSFNSWDEMIQEAVSNYFAEQLGIYSILE